MTVRILVLADEADNKLWDARCKKDLEGIDLILSAGDLPARYLSFLTCFTAAPIVYVHGNHDTSYSSVPPEGCLCAEDNVINVCGLRILGLGGSIRYKPGDCMYTEEEMKKRIRKLRRKLKKCGGFDVLLTHAPMRGLGDQDDFAHRGFECFAPLLHDYHPAALIHGHVHKAYTSCFVREREFEGVRVINASGKYVLELPDPPEADNERKHRFFFLRDFR